MSANTGGQQVNVQRSSNTGLMVLMFVSLAAFIGITAWVTISANKDEQYIEHAGELRVLSQEIAKNAV